MSEFFESQPLVYRYDPELVNYNAFDWGFTAPWVCLDVQVKPCDKGKINAETGEFEACKLDIWFVWREYYVRGFTAEHHCSNLKARSNPTGFSIACGFGDSASPGDIDAVQRLWCPMIAEPEAKADFRRGVKEIQTLLDPAECEGPHLFVDPACVNTISEFKNYKWPQKADPEDTVDEGKPMKREDHAMDALRYLVMHVKVLGGDYHISELADYERGAAYADTSLGELAMLEPSMVLPEHSVFALGRTDF